MGKSLHVSYGKAPCGNLWEVGLVQGERCGYYPPTPLMSTSGCLKTFPVGVWGQRGPARGHAPLGMYAYMHLNSGIHLYLGAPKPQVCLKEQPFISTSFYIHICARVVVMAHYGARCILLLSGKRKSGKDYVAEKLRSSLCAMGPDSKTCILHLSAPLKQEYARQFKLDYDKLLSSDCYKEFYRKDMVAWGEKIRNGDAGFFCRLAVEAGVGFPVWIVSDCRRKSDIQFFEREYSNCFVLKIRVHCSDELRALRGWSYTAGVDDAETECGLDAEVSWDMQLRNDDTNSLDKDANCLVEIVNAKCASVQLPN